jgi:hypothetical protein
MVCRSPPCIPSSLRANGGSGAQILACTVRRRTPPGLDVQACRLQRCVGGRWGTHWCVSPPSPLLPPCAVARGVCPSSCGQFCSRSPPCNRQNGREAASATAERESRAAQRGRQPSRHTRREESDFPRFLLSRLLLLSDAPCAWPSSRLQEEQRAHSAPHETVTEAKYLRCNTVA